LWLGLICLGAFALRVTYVLALRRHSQLAGDAFNFHNGANLLVDGKGFIDPFAHSFGLLRQSAQHPPLYLLVLAIPSKVGLRSVLDHQIWSCLVGTGTVALIGVAGRQIRTPRVGLVAAGVAAVYPNLWLWDGLVLSETMGLFVTALIVVMAYRLWERRAIWDAALLGFACGLGALTRAEAALFLPAIVVPMALMARDLDLRTRALIVVVPGLVAVALVGPWVGFNLSRFHHATLGTSTEFAQTLVLANCDRTYYGDLLGSRYYNCLPPPPQPVPADADETDSGDRYRRVALDFMRAHASRVPVVVLAREGRAWGVFRPFDQLQMDAYLERRDLDVARVGYFMYLALAVASVAGAALLWRRRVPLSPLIAILATVTLAVAVTFGQTRYRCAAEVVLVLLAAVAADHVVSLIEVRADHS
jgi:4-amino-4-deoxy-L-arabinose transferase-like glycosyltransferase